MSKGRLLTVVGRCAVATAMSVLTGCGGGGASSSDAGGTAPVHDAASPVDVRPSTDGGSVAREGGGTVISLGGEAGVSDGSVRADAASAPDAVGTPDVATTTPPADGMAPPPVPDGSLGAALVPLNPCTGTADDVYGPVANLAPMTDALRGDITACTSDGTLDTSAVQSQLAAQADTGVTAVTGVAIYRVQYRTTRASGAAGVSSARIYLPLVPIASQPPVVVAAHGTEGLASSCATSMDATSMRDLALPWASLGYPVIAPDYAGLGTAGVQGYTDNRDTARSVVDSVEALRKFVASTLSPQVVLDGHSQGGGAALATQALATTMNMKGTLAAVIAYAPEYYSHLDSLGFIGALESVAASNPLTISTGVTKCTVATMMEYAYFANYVPTVQPTAGFPASNAASLGSAIESLCTVPLGGAVQAAAVHVADWTDPTLRDEVLACVTGTSVTTDAGVVTCTGPGQAFYEYLLQNILTPDAAGAPVLLVQGLEDIVMPPAQEAACNVITLEAGGVTPQVCTDATASHTDVVQRNIAFGIQWAQAVLAGTARPACAASALPACSQP